MGPRHDPATLGAFEHRLVPDAWGPTTRVLLDVDLTTDGWVAEIMRVRFPTGVVVTVARA